jgi:sterol desaturase/sphingolipid hydroxylase (fatty acid hydroxylase superfamily)
MGVFDVIREAIVSAGIHLLNPALPTSLVSYFGAFVFLIGMTIVTRRQLPRWRAFWKTAFPKRIINHVSTRLDVVLYIANWLILPVAYGLAIIGGNFWATGFHRCLTLLFGAHSGLSTPIWAVVALTTIVEVATVDLGYWFGHYLMHRIPALWEFHKVHHSAEVMTPLTELRQHPVEMVLMPNTISFAGGLATGALTYIFGEAHALSVLSNNIMLVTFFVTISHLRHSHVWLPFTGLLGRVLHSPAHHQIHHSTDPKHFDKNLGFALSVWDWLFGTLWIPRPNERITFGLGAESEEFHTLSGSLLRPVLRAVQSVRPAPVRVEQPQR